MGLPAGSRTVLDTSRVRAVRAGRSASGSMTRRSPRMVASMGRQAACRDFPALSPDGRRLAYLLTCDPANPLFEGIALMVKDLDTGQEQVLGEYNMRPAWSPVTRSTL